MCQRVLNFIGIASAVSLFSHGQGAVRWDSDTSHRDESDGSVGVGYRVLAGPELDVFGIWRAVSRYSTRPVGGSIRDEPVDPTDCSVRNCHAAVHATGCCRGVGPLVRRNALAGPP